MVRPRKIGASVLVALVGCVGAAALSGCGGSRGAGVGSARSAGAHGSYAAYGRCIRTHGVPDYVDPKIFKNGIVAETGEPYMSSPAFKHADRACAGLAPPPITKPPAQFKRQWLTIAACMRAHGLQSFPDPTATPPQSQAERSMALAPGLFLYLGTLDTSSPAFVRAGRACHFPN